MLYKIIDSKAVQVNATKFRSVDHSKTVPFNQEGGAFRAHKVFGDKLETVLEELNEVLV